MKKVRAMDVTKVLVCAVLLVGLFTVLHPCLHEDGTKGMCASAWTGTVAVAGIAAEHGILEMFFENRKIRTLNSVIMLAAAVVCFLMPGVFFRLCMMETMYCHTVMKPGIRILSVCLAGLSLVNLIGLMRKKDVHRKK